MNPSNLDFIDLLQAISIITALVVGFLPNFISVKSADNQINKFGAIMFLLFVIAVVTAFYSTAAKSSSDKEDYKNLFDSTNATLAKSNESIEQSKNLLELHNASMVKLETIQDNELKIQNQGILLSDKSDKIHEKSEELNRNLLQDLLLLNGITKAGDTIIKSLETERKITERHNHLRLLFATTTLRVSTSTLMEALQIDKTDLNSILKNIQTEILKRNQEPHIIDSLSKEAGKVMGRMNQVTSMHIQNLNKDISYTISDSPIVIKAVKEFLDQTLSLLEGQLSNPFLHNNGKLFSIWFKYYNELSVTKSLYYLDKSTINSVMQIKQLMETHNEVVTKILMNSNLKVQIGN